MFSDSPMSIEQLAHQYQQSEDKVNAIAQYNKLLVLQPDNESAKQRLKA